MANVADYWIEIGFEEKPELESLDKLMSELGFKPDENNILLLTGDLERSYIYYDEDETFHMEYSHSEKTKMVNKKLFDESIKSQGNLMASLITEKSLRLYHGSDKDKEEAERLTEGYNQKYREAALNISEKFNGTAFYGRSHKKLV